MTIRRQDHALIRWLTRVLTGSPARTGVPPCSVDERVRRAKACALVATPEAIQFTN